MFTNKIFFEYWSVFPVLGMLLLFLFLIDVILKAISLWRAARSRQIFWFIILLFFNTLSILPIIYLMFFAEDALYKKRSKIQKLPAKKTVKRNKR